MTSSFGRLRSIDLLRACAVLSMFSVHLKTEVMANHSSTGALSFFIDRILGQLAAPLFCFVLGMSFYYAYQKSLRSSKAISPTVSMFLKGFLLYLFGKALILCMPYASFFEAGILELMGLATWCLLLVRSWSNKKLLLMMLAILLLTPFLREYLEYWEYWEMQGGYFGFVPEHNLTGFLSAQAFVGYFPLFPWVLFSMLGFFWGRLQEKSGPTYACKVAVSWGIVFILLASGLSFFHAYVDQESYLSAYFIGVTFFPASIAYILVMFAVLPILQSTLYFFLDHRQSKELPQFIQLFAKYSLSLYVFHVLLIVWMTDSALLEWYGSFSSSLLPFSWGRMLAYQLLFVPLCLFCYLGTWLIDRGGGVFSLEYLLRKFIQIRFRRTKASSTTRIKDELPVSSL